MFLILGGKKTRSNRRRKRGEGRGEGEWPTRRGEEKIARLTWKKRSRGGGRGGKRLSDKGGKKKGLRGSSREKEGGQTDRHFRGRKGEEKSPYAMKSKEDVVIREEGRRTVLCKKEKPPIFAMVEDQGKTKARHSRTRVRGGEPDR